MKRYLLTVVLLLLPSPLAAQTCPGFPARGVQIIDALYNAGLANGTDDDRRQLTRTILEQLVFEMPNDGWTWKSADPGRPPSKDSLSRLVGGRLCNWDWQNGSTRRRGVQAGQPGEDITGQNPIPVAGVNHLGDVPAPVPVPPSQPPVYTSVDLSAVYARLDELKAALGVPVGDSLHAQAERMFAWDQGADADERKRDAEVIDHVDNPGWFKQVFGNRVVQMILAGAGTWVGTKLAN